jgi:hypothetical protein
MTINEQPTVSVWPSATIDNKQEQDRLIPAPLQEWKCYCSHHTGSGQQDTDSGTMAIRENNKSTTNSVMMTIGVNRKRMLEILQLQAAGGRGISDSPLKVSDLSLCFNNG